jgi:hypothetical protein
MSSNATDAEGSVNGTISAITSTGFSVNINGGSGGTNSTGINYVGWQWKGGGTVTAGNNTVGTITSTVSANTTAGFSVVTYTGTGANATVGHGLGVAPSMIIVKSRTSTIDNWQVYHASLGNTQRVTLNSTNAADSPSPGMWNSTSPTISVFSVGNQTGVNAATTYVAYCWAPVAGYSAFGSYTGNGSADGPFIYTGFRPRWVMIKRTDGIGNWWLFDTSRDTYNAMTQNLDADISVAEANNGATIDYLSNGFKLRIATYQPNTSGATFVYAAFAENPLKYANAR